MENWLQVCKKCKIVTLNCHKNWSGLATPSHLERVSVLFVRKGCLLRRTTIRPPLKWHVRWSLIIEAICKIENNFSLARPGRIRKRKHKRLLFSPRGGGVAEMCQRCGKALQALKICQRWLFDRISLVRSTLQPSTWGSIWGKCWSDPRHFPRAADIKLPGVMATHKHTSPHLMISFCSLFRWQVPSSLMLEVPPLLKSPAHHISLSSCRQSSYPLSASFKSVICIQRAIFLTALMSSQLSMVGVRERKSSVTERRTGKSLTWSLFQGYDHHNWPGHHQLTALTQVCSCLGDLNVLEIIIAPSKVLTKSKICTFPRPWWFCNYYIYIFTACRWQQWSCQWRRGCSTWGRTAPHRRWRCTPITLVVRSHLILKPTTLV